LQIPPAKSDSDIRPANQQIGKLREFYLHQLSSYSDTIHFLQSQLHAWRIAERHGNQSPTIVTTTGTVPDDRLQEAYRRINELERILDDAEIRHGPIRIGETEKRKSRWLR
jgi:hypothetical protein